ncbi:HNH endonuclease signature motif containing protein [Nonomuraea basaltis]|uniref:HNH endonuclease signature motif containing protein n=1 Tax=Nonomuraea basaltis TaxID=2495887 RepID=UPI00110C593C|nr:HNH endonuclease signature motif containing protein [Nonomuraea basaltis]TMS00113.1 HNH endonuclease [Nonomuraea basaltis]
MTVYDPPPRRKGGPKPKPIAEQLLRKVTPGHGGCWIWTGIVINSGYPRLGITRQNKTKQYLAHRLSYQLFVGPIPEGMQIDHLCMVRRCVNPQHLEAVTPQINVLRSPNTIASRWGHRTHCERGHEYTAENTYLQPRRDNPDKTSRVCRTCKKAWKRDRKAAQS